MRPSNVVLPDQYLQTEYQKSLTKYLFVELNLSPNIDGKWISSSLHNYIALSVSMIND